MRRCSIFWFWKALYAFFWRVDRDVVTGVVAMVVFGFFHETIKQFYGAFDFVVRSIKSYEDSRLKQQLKQYVRFAVNQSCVAS